MTPTRTVVTVLGKDRSRIVATIATTLADCGANIDDISQTILGEGRMFSMTMMVTLDPAVADFNTVQEGGLHTIRKLFGRSS